MAACSGCVVVCRIAGGVEWGDIVGCVDGGCGVWSDGIGLCEVAVVVETQCIASLRDLSCIAALRGVEEMCGTLFIDPFDLVFCQIEHNIDLFFCKK